MIAMLLLLLFWHFLADFPLQGDYLARFKDPTGIGNTIWPWCLAAHCVIQAGGTYIITGWWVIFFLELVSHAAIDYAKCRNRISFGMDQTLHLGCKLVWVILLVVR
jgi:Protein of unknown function (DUF3307)